MAKSYKPHKIKVCRTYGNLYKDIKKGYEFIIKLIILQVFITPHRVLIKSSESLENKGFIAIITPYFFI